MRELMQKSNKNILASCTLNHRLFDIIILTLAESRAGESLDFSLREWNKTIDPLFRMQINHEPNYLFILSHKISDLMEAVDISYKPLLD